MRKLLLLSVLIPLLSLAHPIAEMSINEKCDLQYDYYYQVVSNIYNGRTLNEQYNILNSIDANKSQIDLLKNITKIVYDNAPINKSPAEKAIYQIEVAEKIRDKCIEQYLQADPDQY